MRLKLFGKRLAIAPDDLYMPLLLLFVFRLCWIPLMALAYHGLWDCSFGGWLLPIYGTGFFMITSLCMIIELVTITLATFGTVSDSSARKNLPLFAHLEACMLIIDLCWQVFGLVTISGPRFYAFQGFCRASFLLDYMYWIRIVVVWAFFTKAVFFLGGISMYLFGSWDFDLKLDANSYLKTWQRRLNWIFSGYSLHAGQSETIGELSKVLSDYFQDLDWAPSDVAVGLILLKREQKLVREATEVVAALPTGRAGSFLKSSALSALRTFSYTSVSISEASTEIPYIIEVSGAKSLSCVAEENSAVSAAYDMPAIEMTDFGRKFDSEGSSKTLHEPDAQEKVEPNATPSTRKATSANRRFSLTRKMDKLPDGTAYETFPKQNRRKAVNAANESMFSNQLAEPSDRPLIREDVRDILHFSHYAEMAYVGLDPQTHSMVDLLLHISPRNDIFHSPYLVSVDNDWKCVVIAIRGTYSTQDVLTDLNIASAQLTEDDPKKLAHSGMLKTARNILEDLKMKKILDKIFANETTAEYDIVVTGHSLGAGVGALLAYSLRQSGYKYTRCYAFPPGGLINSQSREDFESFCISVVMGDDIVPRVSLPSLDHLKKEVGRLLNDCDEPKYKVFASVVKNALSGISMKTKALMKHTKNDFVDDEVHPLKRLPAEALKLISKTSKTMPSLWIPDNAVAVTFPSELEDLPMFIPGKILYVEKIRDFAAQFVVEQLEKDYPTKRDSSLQVLKKSIEYGMTKLVDRKKDFKYLLVPRWATAEEFNTVVVSKSMITDHLVFESLYDMENFPFGKPLVNTT